MDVEGSEFFVYCFEDFFSVFGVLGSSKCERDLGDFREVMGSYLLRLFISFRFFVRFSCCFRSDLS